MLTGTMSSRINVNQKYVQNKKAAYVATHVAYVMSGNGSVLKKRKNNE